MSGRPLEINEYLKYAIYLIAIIIMATAVLWVPILWFWLFFKFKTPFVPAGI
jgi:hypothetical protein